MTWLSRPWVLLGIFTEFLQCTENSVEFSLIPVSMDCVVGRHQPSVADAPQDVFCRHKSVGDRVERLGSTLSGLLLRCWWRRGGLRLRCWRCSCFVCHFSLLSSLIDLDHPFAPTQTLGFREVFWYAFTSLCQPNGREVLDCFLGHKADNKRSLPALQTLF